MHWTGKYIIDETGRCRWQDGLRIHDTGLLEAFNQDPVIELFVDGFAMRGVQTGIA